MFSIRPFTSLVGFLFVPAHKRVPLGAVLDLLQTVFLGICWRFAASSIVSHEWVQDAMKSATDFVKQQAEQAQKAQRVQQIPRVRRVEPEAVAEIAEW